MHSWHHVAIHAQRYGFKHRLLYSASLMILFWSIFDGILTYILPLMIVEHGFNRTEMGMIIGISSIAGAAFDLFLGKFLHQPTFRRLYLAVFILSFLFAFLLYGANTIWMYMFAMATWGIYWDLFNFANADFVSKTSPPEERTSAYGVINVFKASGFLLAPIIAGLVMGIVVDRKPFIVAATFLGISLLFYLSLNARALKNHKPEFVRNSKLRDRLNELVIWKSLGKQLFPILVLTFLVFVTDAFFWTLGPLVAEELTQLDGLKGLFLTVYLLPSLVLGWFIGEITQRFGKKRTALFSFLVGSAIISTLALISNPFVLLGVVFLASTFLSMCLPAISSAFTDYISETTYLQKEIQSMADLFYNAGWAIGPMIAGFLADTFGNKQSFSILGIFSVCVTLILIKMMPKKIKVKVVAS